METRDVWELVDICECGDYRFQHGLGEHRGKMWARRGKCSICSPNDMMNRQDCPRFRFWEHHPEAPEFLPKAKRAR